MSRPTQTLSRGRSIQLPDPTVSAVIAVLDGEKFLAEAIESVLGQTVPCTQVVVVDNGSVDRSREVAERYTPQVTVLDEPKRGIGPARNAGLAAAEGDFVGVLDCDDLWEPHKNEIQLDAFARIPDLGLVFGHVVQFADSSYDPSLHGELDLSQGPQPGLFLPSMLAPLEVWRQVGPWSEDVGVSDGLEWLLRARALGLREEMLPDLVMRRRIHNSNHSRRKRHEVGEFAHFLKRAIDERRRREVR